MTLAGRAADEPFGERDAGAGGGQRSDLGKVLRLLALTHASFGLSGTLLSLDPEEAEAQIPANPALAQAIEANLQQLYPRAKLLVREHQTEIEMLAVALVV
jgi:hypothetical protein